MVNSYENKGEKRLATKYINRSMNDKILGMEHDHQEYKKKGECEK